MFTDRDDSEGTIHNAGPDSGIDWTLDACFHKDAGGVVENLLKRWRYSVTNSLFFPPLM